MKKQLYDYWIFYHDDDDDGRVIGQRHFRNEAQWHKAIRRMHAIGFPGHVASSPLTGVCTVPLVLVIGSARWLVVRRGTNLALDFSALTKTKVQL